MSRLYEAARRFHKGADAEESGIWEALGSQPPETVEAAQTRPENPADVPAARPGTPAAMEVQAGGPETAVLAPTYQLDRRARLLPYSIDAAVTEHYRRLRTKILHEQSLNPFRTLLVTSPNPREGKTLTVLNLALIFAVLPQTRVLVVDGDMRKGSVATWLSTDRHQLGFSNFIEGSVKLEEAVFQAPDMPIWCMAAGNSHVPPGELLNSPTLKSRLAELAEGFDLVVVDSPPANLLTDAQLLAASCDAVLLVARAFSTNRVAFEKTAADLAPYRIIGTVLNGCGTTRTDRYGYYYSKNSL